MPEEGEHVALAHGEGKTPHRLHARGGQDAEGLAQGGHNELVVRWRLSRDDSQRRRTHIRVQVWGQASLARLAHARAESRVATPALEPVSGEEGEPGPLRAALPLGHHLPYIPRRGHGQEGGDRKYLERAARGGRREGLLRARGQAVDEEDREVACVVGPRVCEHVHGVAVSRSPDHDAPPARVLDWCLCHRGGDIKHNLGKAERGQQRLHQGPKRRQGLQARVVEELDKLPECGAQGRDDGDAPDTHLHHVGEGRPRATHDCGDNHGPAEARERIGGKDGEHHAPVYLREEGHLERRADGVEEEQARDEVRRGLHAPAQPVSTFVEPELP
mmetsp:Transcript_4141/g.11988  ORF Transcript_4141/g.11988 Transcript_4141/m.11988 type:complete len:331 (-) Transcript_4141:980-1972(-)